MVGTEQEDEAEYQQHGVVQHAPVEGPALYLPHDELVPGLHVLVLCPAGGEGLTVGREPGIPSEPEPSHDGGQVQGLRQLVVSRNLGNLEDKFVVEGHKERRQFTCFWSGHISPTALTVSPDSVLSIFKHWDVLNI